jgi:hypothetical protein
MPAHSIDREVECHDFERALESNTRDPMRYKTDIRFGVRDSSGEELILPNDVLKRAAVEYRRRLQEMGYVVVDVDTREDTLVVTLETLDSDAGHRLDDGIRSNALDVQVKGRVRESAIDETGFPVVKELAIDDIELSPR